MLKMILVSILIFISGQTIAVEYDNKKDDHYHIAVSVVIGGGAQYFFQNWKYSMATCLSIGLAKEVYDQVDYGGFSRMDLAKDALGCTVGVLAASFIWPNDKANNLAFSFTSNEAYLKYQYSF